MVEPWTTIRAMFKVIKRESLLWTTLCLDSTLHCRKRG